MRQTEKKKDLLTSMTPTFSPQLNKKSLKMAKETISANLYIKGVYTPEVFVYVPPQAIQKSEKIIFDKFEREYTLSLKLILMR